MSTTPVLNLEMEQKATFSYLFTVQGANSAVLDLTPYTLRSQMKTAYTAVSASAELSCRIDDPTTGKFFLEMAASGSANITPGDYVYDVLLINGDDKSRLVKGEICVSPGVTDAE